MRAAEDLDGEYRSTLTDTVVLVRSGGVGWFPLWSLV